MKYVILLFLVMSIGFAEEKVSETDDTKKVKDKASQILDQIAKEEKEANSKKAKLMLEQITKKEKGVSKETLSKLSEVNYLLLEANVCLDKKDSVRAGELYLKANKVLKSFSDDDKMILEKRYEEKAKELLNLTKRLLTSDTLLTPIEKEEKIVEEYEEKVELENPRDTIVRWHKYLQENKYQNFITEAFQKKIINQTKRETEAFLEVFQKKLQPLLKEAIASSQIKLSKEDKTVEFIFLKENINYKPIILKEKNGAWILHSPLPFVAKHLME